MLLCLWGLGVACWPMFSSGFKLMEVDPADSRHLNYVLEHGYRWLAGRAELFNPGFFYPDQNVSAYTELLLGVLPFYAAWRLVGLEPDTAFQAWMVTVAAVNYLAAWLLFRRALAFGPLAAAAGAFLFSFGSSRVAQINHQHLLPHFLTVFAVHALARLFQPTCARPRLWLGVFFSSVVLQLYAGLYLGWFLCFGLLVLGGWALALPQTRTPLLALVRARWWELALGAVGSALCLVPLLSPYLAAARAVGVRRFADAWQMVPQVQSWFYLGPNSWLYGWLAQLDVFSRLPMEGEHRLGLGLATTAVLVAVLVRERRRPWVRALGLTTLFIVLCATLYRGRMSPWQLVMAAVPGASALRAVARIALLLLIPAGFALATFVEQALAKAGWRRWLALGVAALCVLEQGQRVGSFDKAEQRADVAQLVAAIDPACPAFFSAPVHGYAYDEKTQLDAMWAQLQTGIPTVNGYSSNFPRGWELFAHTMTDEAAQRPALEAKLSRWVLSRGLGRDQVCFVVVLERPPP